MTADQELWALVMHVEQSHGRAALAHIAERIGAAAVAGDQVGVDLWKAVAVRYDQLSSQSLGRA